VLQLLTRWLEVLSTKLSTYSSTPEKQVEGTRLGRQRRKCTAAECVVPVVPHPVSTTFLEGTADIN
jgi:hypothetical protein